VAAATAHKGIMKKIIVGLPTYNEADNIARTAVVVDRGLAGLRDAEGIIVNADNNSPDRTSLVFSKLRLRARKHIIVNEMPGKGINIRSIFVYAKEVGADAVVLLDSDVVSMRPDWVTLLSQRVLSKQVEAVFPLYHRSRYDATATNHLVIPVLMGMTGKLISQPIGGEFCFSGQFAQEAIPLITTPAYGYGVDVCLTSIVLNKNLPYEEIKLGEKMHRPGQHKIAQLFLEVFEALFTYLPEFKGGQDDMPNIYSVTRKVDVLSDKRRLMFEGEAARTMAERLTALDYIGLSRLNNTEMNTDQWTSLLALVIRLIRYKPKLINVIGEQLVPLFLRRNLYFWSEIQDLTPAQVEYKIIEQAIMLRRKLRTEFVNRPAH
jgi:glycosyltransferase involved in cell wall biosynthesis